jgi:hypothetical protein
MRNSANALIEHAWRSKAIINKTWHSLQHTAAQGMPRNEEVFISAEKNLAARSCLFIDCAELSVCCAIV